MKHEQNDFFFKSFVKLFWRKFLDSWKCSYFQNVSWYERNVYLLLTTCKWCVKRSVFILANWWHWILMHCQVIIFYKFVCSGVFFFFFCSRELINCLALGKTQRLSLSLFTQPSNQWRRGGDKYYTNQSSCTTIEKLILLVTAFLYSVIFLKWDTSNTLLPWIFLIIATKASQLEKCCATKVFSSATSWPFSEKHLAFFQVLQSAPWTMGRGDTLGGATRVAPPTSNSIGL